MYLALRPPWARPAITRAPGGDDVVVVARPDAGVGKPKKKKRRPNTVAPSPGGGDVQPGEDSELEETEPAPPPLTAAQRKLETRGDDVALPATRIDVGARGEARSLDDGEIRAAIAGQAGPVRDCVVHGATGTDLRATITVVMVVDGSGKVVRSRIEAPRYLFEQGLLACAQRAVGRWKFPATGAPTRVTLPVNLG